MKTKLLTFLLVLTTLLFLIATPVLVSSEIIPKENYKFLPDEYTVSGKIKGCGFRFNAMNSKFIFISGSIGIQFLQERPIGILKLVAHKLTPLNKQSLARNLFVNYGWLKTVNGTVFKEEKSLRGEIEDHFMSISSDAKNFTTVLIESMEGGLKIGFNQKPNTYDSIFEITNPPSKEIKDRVYKCTNELINYYDK